MAAVKRSVSTIGHSTHTIERFVDLLRQHGVTATVDVRSVPYSRFQPQFNRETLQTTLKIHGIAYVFLGKELGARSDDPSCYQDGRVQYRRLARTKAFKAGLEWVRSESELIEETYAMQEKRIAYVDKRLVQEISRTNA